MCSTSTFGPAWRWMESMHSASHRMPLRAGVTTVTITAGLPEAVPNRTDGRPSVPPSFDPAKPDLSPVGIDAARAVLVVVGGANDVFQDDAVATQAKHPAGLLVDDPLHPPQHPGLPAAIPQHLGVRRLTAIQIVAVECPHDLALGLDLHELTGLQVEDLPRRPDQLPVDEREAPAVPDEKHSWKELPVGCLELVEQHDQHAAKHARRRGVAGHDVAHILPEIPPVDVLGCCIVELRRLAR